MARYRKLISALGLILPALLTPDYSTADTQPQPSGEVAPTKIDGCPATDTEDFAGYISGDWQTPVPGKLQKILIASDPQPFRAMFTRQPWREDADESKWKSNLSAAYMSGLALQRQGDAYVPFIINGDMTEFGHGNERQALRERLKQAPSGKRGPLMLPGLGNHDYANNVGRCANNGCVRDAVCDHITWVKAIQAKSRGVNFDYTYQNKTHSGSLAYSFDIGKVHIVQLNQEPTYTVEFQSGVADKHDFKISSSMPWLAADLRSAKARGQITLVNLHQRAGWKSDSVRDGEFKNLLEANGVVAVFAGHYHDQVGRAGSIGKIPVFQSGALMARSYLALYFDWHENIMHVKNIVDSVDAGEEFVRIGPAPEPPGGSLRVTLYAQGNMQGSACNMDITPGAEKQWIDKKCPQQANNQFMSMKVSGYVPSMGSLCLHGMGTQRCYFGNYSGDFSIPQFKTLNDLPPGLKRKGWGFAAEGFYTIELGNQVANSNANSGSR